jgi:NhaP-type Na+/H+ or K+/H+ antiporter
LEESGLLTVTIMGVVMANSRIASLTDMRRFKETITTLLVSGVFIILTASLSMADISSLDISAAIFVAALLSGHPAACDHDRHNPIRRHSSRSGC